MTPPLLSRLQNRDLNFCVIDIWLFSSRTAVDDTGRALLSDAERNRADRFRVPLQRSRFLARRVHGRRILGCYLNVPAYDVDWTAEGPPVVTCRGGPSQVSVSLSHSGDVAALAVAAAGTSIGIDIERTDGGLNVEALQASSFTRGETDWLQGLPAEDRAVAARRLWTTKEALFKSQAVSPRWAPQAIDVQALVAGGAEPKGKAHLPASARVLQFESESEERPSAWTSDAGLLPHAVAGTLACVGGHDVPSEADHVFTNRLPAMNARVCGILRDLSCWGIETAVRSICMRDRKPAE